MLYEGFAPGAAQRLEGLKALRSQVLVWICAAGATCLVVRVALMG
jgi:hypothetical protein